MTAMTVEIKDESKIEGLELTPQTSPTDSSLNQVTNHEAILLDNLNKEVDIINKIDYNTASPSEILPTISSDEGIISSNTESFLTSSQFEDVLIRLEKHLKRRIRSKIMFLR
jgi:hypothetical protein